MCFAASLDIYFHSAAASHSLLIEFFTMHSYKIATLFAGAAIAQKSATVLNFFQFDSTLTMLGSDATATTYEHSCPSSAAGISAVPSNLRM